MPAFIPLIENTSRPVRPSVSRFCPGLNSSASTPIPIRLLRWIRSKFSAITARTPSSSVPLAAQSREEPVPYSLPAITLRGFEDSRLLTVGQMHGEAALNAGHQEILEPDICERPAHHHFMISTPRSVRVEILRMHAVLDQILACWRVWRDRTRGRDMISRHAVTEHREHACAGYIRELADL